MTAGASTILHVITGLGDGGAEGVLYRLCKHDRACNHVVVSLMDGGRYAEPLQALGVPVHSLGLKRGRIGPRAVLRLRALLKHYKPDVVQTWMYHADLLGGLVARLAGTPRIVWGIRHGELAPGKTKLTTVAIAHLCARLSHRVPDVIVCCSDTAREIHAELGYNQAKFDVIPNGYELDRLVPDAGERKRFRAELGVPDGMPLLGTVARFAAQKDHPNLFHALSGFFSEGRDFRVALIGTGMTHDNEEMAALAETLGLHDRLHLLGQREDISTVMNGIDIHVLPSASEGFPNVVAEAMGCGTPCVVTDVGDAAAIASPTGWVVKPGDSDALAGAIASALDAMHDAPAWQMRKTRSREHVAAHFGIGKMIERYHRAWAVSP